MNEAFIRSLKSILNLKCSYINRLLHRCNRRIVLASEECGKYVTEIAQLLQILLRLVAGDECIEPTLQERLGGQAFSVDGQRILAIVEGQAATRIETIL